MVNVTFVHNMCLLIVLIICLRLFLLFIHHLLNILKDTALPDDQVQDQIRESRNRLLQMDYFTFITPLKDYESLVQTL